MAPLQDGGAGVCRMSGLEELVQERKRMAIERRIGEKSRMVACFLGKKDGSAFSGGVATEGTPAHWHHTFLYEDGALSITAVCSSEDEYGVGHCISSRVSAYGANVFENAGGSVLRYVPGQWENLLEHLVPRAEERAETYFAEQKDAERRMGEAQERKVRSRWGL